ncbi:hypothetical protein AB0N05_32650 [Nocardia sp. NPDC051030]|uniref:hypothetical protein n=1 Tax=Nocardia sp. NPDC051030 TaxID=3155162 RepID=UPI00342B4E2F
MGALAATLVLTAPAAPAAITDFTVKLLDPAFVTDCAYITRATTESGSQISFYDSQDGEFNPSSGTGDVLVTWTPHTPGLHTLHAVQDGSERTIGIDVGPGGSESECTGVSLMYTDH